MGVAFLSLPRAEPALLCSRRSVRHERFEERMYSMADPSSGQKRAIGYVINLGPGPHRLVSVEGVGTCREPFAQLVARMEHHECDVVVAVRVALFFIDTSPLWMERFITVAKRHGILVADASGAPYDLRRPGDEAAFRACGRAL
jgi:hypothetical protein